MRSDSPNRLLKAAIAFFGPISVPLLVITGISLTAVPVIALVGKCICWFTANTGGIDRDEVLRNYQETGGIVTKACCNTGAWLFQSVHRRIRHWHHYSRYSGWEFINLQNLAENNLLKATVSSLVE